MHGVVLLSWLGGTGAERGTEKGKIKAWNKSVLIGTGYRNLSLPFGKSIKQPSTLGSEEYSSKIQPLLSSLLFP